MVNYWLKDKDAPFATLLTMVGTFCDPEAGADAYEELIDLARHTNRFSEKTQRRMARFKGELRRALLGDMPPKWALSAAGGYNDGSPEAFLRRLWRDLYPDEPLPGQ